MQRERIVPSFREAEMWGGRSHGYAEILRLMGNQLKPRVPGRGPEVLKGERELLQLDSGILPGHSMLAG